MAGEWVLVLKGPNLNRLGEREEEIYGLTTLSEVEDLVPRRTEELSREGEFYRGQLRRRAGKRAPAGEGALRGS